MEMTERIQAAKEQEQKDKAAGVAFLNRLKAGDINAIDEALQNELYTKTGTLRKHNNEKWLLLLMIMKSGTSFEFAFNKSFPQTQNHGE